MGSLKALNGSERLLDPFLSLSAMAIDPPSIFLLPWINCCLNDNTV